MCASSSFQSKPNGIWKEFRWPSFKALGDLSNSMEQILTVIPSFVNRCFWIHEFWSQFFDDGYEHEITFKVLISLFWYSPDVWYWITLFYLEFSAFTSQVIWKFPCFHLLHIFYLWKLRTQWIFTGLARFYFLKLFNNLRDWVMFPQARYVVITFNI